MVIVIVSALRAAATSAGAGLAWSILAPSPGSGRVGRTLTPLGPRAGTGSGAAAVFLSGSRPGKGRTGSEMAASRVARRRRNAKTNQDGE